MKRRSTAFFMSSMRLDILLGTKQIIESFVCLRPLFMVTDVDITWKPTVRKIWKRMELILHLFRIKKNENGCIP